MFRRTCFMDKMHIFIYDRDGPSLAGARHPSPIFLLQSAFNLDQVPVILQTHQTQWCLPAKLIIQEPR